MKEISEVQNETETFEDDDYTKVTDLSKYVSHKYRWRSSQQLINNIEFCGKGFCLPQCNADTLTPLNYFQMFWKNELNEFIAEQTNLYSVQKKLKSIVTTSGEIEQLLGIQMLMSIVKLPSCRMYWAAETKYPQIAEVMSRNRYVCLRECLHLNDNSKKDEIKNKNNKLFKIQPVLDHVRNNCIMIEPEIEHSIDEQIIPAKTKYSGIKQYNPKKPVKWGFKNFVRAGKSGIIYDFFLYSGSSNSGKKCTGAYVVLKLLEKLPKNQNFKVFFDNWFCSMQLCLALKELGFVVTATIRSDRIKGCQLATEKELQKQGRGSQVFKTDANSRLILTRWYDNKCVNLISTYCDPLLVTKTKRWDRKYKTYIDIDCPSVVQEYNKSMGGVDLADMLISLYRTTIKTKRWYLKVFFHCLDIAKVNGWLFYRRHCDQLKVPKKSQMSLLKFTSDVASGLINS
ncbi:piggyBac transposable element-derived protein 3 [Hydra vulgaris]|uniref:piggyBac transposable element-derived protein 3 n=1 Tax=Hydra vulgaris TaxID=6087 RepID=UPI0002B43278|nr:piggyBac transposable element-derived protein 3-like [Hydra vulgaris]